MSDQLLASDAAPKNPRESWLDAGWARGVFVDLKKPNGILNTLPERLVKRVQQSQSAYLIPLLYDCALVDECFDSEPWAPVMICWNINNPLGNFMNGKNPRTYHFELVLDGENQWFEATALGLWFVCRKSLLTEQIDSSIKWPEGVLKRVLIWSSSRSTREVFPDDWNQNLSIVHKRLEKIWKSSDYEHISEVLLRIEPNEDGYGAEVILTLPDEAIQKLGARHLFKPGGPAETLELRLKTAMTAAQGVNVKAVKVMPESQLTLTMIRNYQRWHLDYYSFRSYPEGNRPASSTE
ncbi:hypothetical protein [Zobellella denitrificans]|uniref:hypothetical protein n=1 Tax=Zobellella denitrificans TaxID=347534 RepID=UPI00115F19A4|nr:hypothetical protein [Zobellella denitrificans]